MIIPMVNGFSHSKTIMIRYILNGVWMGIMFCAGVWNVMVITPREGVTKTVAFELSQGKHRRLKAVCAALGINQGALLARLVDKFLDEESASVLATLNQQSGN
ncbi:MAG: hypothetical protein ABFE02_04620 [Sulfuricella sp.]